MKGLGVDRPIARLGVTWPGVLKCYLAFLLHATARDLNLGVHVDYEV